MSKWKEGTGFFKGQQFRKNIDGTEDFKYKDNGKEIREQRQYPQNVYKIIDRKTGKVLETFTDSEKYIWVDRESDIGTVERKGESLHPSLAKRVNKKGGSVKTSKYAKGGGVRTAKYKV